MSHDWPTGIHQYGDAAGLLGRKPHFRDDIERGELGSPPAEMLLKKLKPKYWFSAHLHVKFAAFVDHSVEDVEDEGEIVLEDSDEERPQVEGKSPGKRAISPSAEDSEAKRRRQEGDGGGSGEKQTTRFLALDKCLPHRDFLQLLDIEMESHDSSTDTFSYDPQWLAITKTFHPYLSTTFKQNDLPSEDDLQTYCPGVLAANRSQINENLKWVNENIKDLTVPKNFEPVAPIHDANDPPQSRKQRTSPIVTTT